MSKLLVALRHPILWFRAVILNDDESKCRISASLGLIDYHNPKDEDFDSQWDLTKMHCKRCGKCFTPKSRHTHYHQQCL